MSLDHDHAEDIPKVPLMMIGGIALLSLALAATASSGLIARDGVPETSRAVAGTQPIAQRSLFFSDANDGAVVVEDAATREEIARIEPGTGGFIRSTMRSLVHVRMREGIGAQTPFELTRWDDGGLTLSDPATGETRELVGFGDTNRAAFAVLLEPEAG